MTEAQRIKEWHSRMPHSTMIISIAWQLEGKHYTKDFIVGKHVSIEEIQETALHFAEMDISNARWRYDGKQWVCGTLTMKITGGEL